MIADVDPLAVFLLITQNDTQSSAFWLFLRVSFRNEYFLTSDCPCSTFLRPSHFRCPLAALEACLLATCLQSRGMVYWIRFLGLTNEAQVVCFDQSQGVHSLRESRVKQVADLASWSDYKPRRSANYFFVDGAMPEDFRSRGIPAPDLFVTSSFCVPSSRAIEESGVRSVVLPAWHRQSLFTLAYGLIVKKHLDAACVFGEYAEDESEERAEESREVKRRKTPGRAPGGEGETERTEQEEGVVVHAQSKRRKREVMGEDGKLCAIPAGLYRAMKWKYGLSGGKVRWFLLPYEEAPSKVAYYVNRPSG